MRSRLVFTESYNQRAAKWLRRHPGLRGQYAKTLELMELNIHHPSLRLQRLSGRLSGLSAVSINMSYRITIEVIISDAGIILVGVGAHDDVYRSTPTVKTQKEYLSGVDNTATVAA